MFIKEKRDREIKGRVMAGVKNQCDCIYKEYASSPTITTKTVLLSCSIDAEEESDITIIDILNAFILTQVEDEKDMAFIKICGVLVDILVEISPDVYKSHVTTDKNSVKQLLVQ